jgi:hypothetical protein
MFWPGTNISAGVATYWAWAKDAAPNVPMNRAAKAYFFIHCLLEGSCLVFEMNCWGLLSAKEESR